MESLTNFKSFKVAFGSAGIWNIKSDFSFFGWIGNHLVVNWEVYAILLRSLITAAGAFANLLNSSSGSQYTLDLTLAIFLGTA